METKAWWCQVDSQFTMFIYSKFYGSPYYSCWDISVRVKKKLWIHRLCHLHQYTNSISAHCCQLKAGDEDEKCLQRWPIYVCFCLVTLLQVVPVQVSSVILQSVDGTQTELQISDGENLNPLLLNRTLCANVVLKVILTYSSTCLNLCLWI